MIRRILLASLFAASAAHVVLAAHQATFVLNNGDRVSGALTYKGTNSATLNGRDYPFSDIAVIEFAGEPSAAELRQVPDIDNNPQEFQRHVFVTRGGNVILAKLYHISADGETITYDQGQDRSQRHEISANDLARIYMNPASGRRVFASILNGAPAATPAPVATTGVGGQGLIVNGNQPWTDTSIDVRRGDRVTFRASGQIQIAMGNDAAVFASPDGSSTFPAPRTGYPVPGVPVGALIGKVGNSQPFVIGNNTGAIQMPASGRLSLGINDDGFGDNSGAFTVVIAR